MPIPGVTASSVGAWSPSQLPNLALWLDASNPDSLSTTSPVVTWSDVSGNGRHYSSAVSTQRPTIEPTGLNSKPVVRFDRASGHITERAPFMTHVDQMILAAVVRTDSGQPTTIRMYWGLGNNNHVGLSQQTESTAWYGFVYGGVAWVHVVPAKVDFWDVMVYQRESGGNGYVRSKGVQQGGTTAATPNAATTRTTIGGDAFGSGTTSCRVAELVAVDGAWTTTDRDLLENYLKTKWGL